MLEQQFIVRFYETDALGHVNNTVIPGWFETGRLPIFDFFGDMAPDKRSLIVARLEVDYVKPVYFGKPITVKTYIARLGGSSFDIGSEVWQDGELCAKGINVMVYFDYQTQKAVPLTTELREKLATVSHPEHPVEP